MQYWRMKRPALLGLVALVVAAAAPVGAQHRTTYLRFQVIDSLGTPIAGAEVTAILGLTSTLGSVITDVDGRRSMGIPWHDDRDYELSVRRLGYLKGTQFFRPTSDTMDITIKLRPAPQMMETIVVTPEEDLKRKRFFIDADAIAQSERPIRTGLDVVTKLRPDMIKPPGAGIYTSCGLWYIWINGKRIVFPPVNPQLEATTRINRRMVGSTRQRSNSRLSATGASAINLSVQSVLHSIKPEHIEEMKFVDCWDTEMKMARAQGGLFVVLKEGIGFRSGKGSYVAFDTSDAIVR
jgi:hypothetical protein